MSSEKCLSFYPTRGFSARLNAKRLKPHLMKTWDWRIEFQVDDDARTITVLRIGHRDKFYDEYTGS